MKLGFSVQQREKQKTLAFEQEKLAILHRLKQSYGIIEQYEEQMRVCLQK